MLFIFFFEGYGDHRDLHALTHSFPTRRSSDLQDSVYFPWSDGSPSRPVDVSNNWCWVWSARRESNFAPLTPEGSWWSRQQIVHCELWISTLEDRKSTRLNSSH